MKDYLGEGEYVAFFGCRIKRDLKPLNIFTALYILQNYTKTRERSYFPSVTKHPSFQHNKQQLLRDLSSSFFRI